MTLRSWRKNRASRRRNFVARRRDVRGWFWVEFGPIMEDFKAQTRGIKKEDDLGRILGVFEGEQLLWVETP